MNLVVGNTYTIELDGATATQGYEQLEEFINFSNTIFQILSVSTTYSPTRRPGCPNPNDRLYADACGWENDPNSPNYRSCVGGDGKAGGTVITTYTVKIISGGGTSQTLSSLDLRLLGQQLPLQQRLRGRRTRRERSSIRRSSRSRRISLRIRRRSGRLDADLYVDEPQRGFRRRAELHGRLPDLSRRDGRRERLPARRRRAAATSTFAPVAGARRSRSRTARWPRTATARSRVKVNDARGRHLLEHFRTSLHRLSGYRQLRDRHADRRLRSRRLRLAARRRSRRRSRRSSHRAPSRSARPRLSRSR